MAVEWVVLDEAVTRVMAGEIVNATAVAGILAASAAITNGLALRDPSADWIDQPTALQSRKHGDA